MFDKITGDNKIPSDSGKTEESFQKFLAGLDKSKLNLFSRGIKPLPNDGKLDEQVGKIDSFVINSKAREKIQQESHHDKTPTATMNIVEKKRYDLTILKDSDSSVGCNKIGVVFKESRPTIDSSGAGFVDNRATEAETIDVNAREHLFLKASHEYVSDLFDQLIKSLQTEKKEGKEQSKDGSSVTEFRLPTLEEKALQKAVEKLEDLKKNTLDHLTANIYSENWLMETSIRIRLKACGREMRKKNVKRMQPNILAPP